MLDYVTSRSSMRLAHWNITGGHRGNTSDGRLWFALTQSGSNFELTLFRDDQHGLAVASGVGAAPGTLVLSAVNDSGIAGSVEIVQPQTGDGELDVFYACDADLMELARDLPQQQVDGNFAGGPGFSVPCARAKRLMDALLWARLGPDFRADCLAPLAPAASLFALSFLYEWLAARADDAATALAAHFASRARDALPGLRLQSNGHCLAPFASRLTRG